MSEEILVGREGAVQVLRINRPGKKNALTEAMYDRLSSAIESAEADDTCAAHLIVGSEGVFSAGNDINDFLATARATGSLGPQVTRFVMLLPHVKKPLIAAVDGPAIGIGTTMLFHFDLVFASPRATFSTPFVDLALVPEAGSSLLMPMRLGYARAFEMLGLGAVLGAERMREAGLVNAVVPPEDVERAALSAAAALARKPRQALAMARALMRGESDRLMLRITEEAEAFRKGLSSPEARAAFEAFLNRGRG